jgi:GNAT superfamily N-acetyltransferase
MQISDLTRQMLSESPFANMGDDIDYLLQVSKEQGGLFVEYEGEDVIGFLVAILVFEHPIIGSCKMATELGWYVHPDFRHKGVARRLLDRYDDWSYREGCTHSMTSAMFNDSFDQVKSLYEKRGYKMVEASFIKQISGDIKEVK